MELRPDGSFSDDLELRVSGDWGATVLPSRRSGSYRVTTGAVELSYVDGRVSWAEFEGTALDLGDRGVHFYLVR